MRYSRTVATRSSAKGLQNRHSALVPVRSHSQSARKGYLVVAATAVRVSGKLAAFDR